jgi:acetate---CoA ligase (ADP-forming)
VLVKLSALLAAAPEIMEMDLNPLLGSAQRVVAVDARISISHTITTASKH